MSFAEAIETFAPVRRFKPHPAYKDPGVIGLGPIPVDWEVAPIYARYEVALGKMLDAKRVTGEFSGLYLRNVDVQWDAVATESLPAMDFAPWERERYLLRPGDLLVCEGGEVGRTAIWRGEIEECFYQKALHRVRPRSPKEEPRFFYYIMHSMAKRGVFVAGGNPNTIDHLTAVQLRHYRFPFPPADEQRAVVAFLDQETARIDALVAKKEKLIDLLQEQRTALITRAVTKGLNPRVPMKDSGIEWLGEIPAHWDMKPLSQILSRITYGFTNPMPVADEGGPYMLTAFDIGDGEILFENARHTTEEAFDHLLTDKSRPRRGDLLITKDGTLGRVAVAGEERVCINQSVALLRFDSSKVVIDFMQNALRAAPYQDRMIFEAGGTAIKHIYITRLAKMPVALPPVREQAEIGNFLSTGCVEIDLLQRKVQEAIDRLREFRTATISAAVTGKIDVRGEIA
jgi:type I restriction enzyme, S subunit